MKSTGTVLLIGCLSVTSCLKPNEKKKTDKKPAEAANSGASNLQAEPNLSLKFEDFNSITYTKLTKADLEGAGENSVNEQLDLFQDDEDEPNNEDSMFDSCFSQKWALQDPKDKSTITMSTKSDMTSCFNEAYKKSPSYESNPFSFKKSTYDIMIWIQCPGEDLSFIVGKTMNDNIEKPCKKKTKMKMSLVSVIEGSAPNPEQYSFVNQSSHGVFTKNGSACEQSIDGDKITYSDGCYMLDKSSSSTNLSGEKEASETLVRQKYSGVTGIQGMRFYKTSSFELFYNGW